MLPIADVLTGTGGRLASGEAIAGFTGVSIDSRTVRPGDLFVALRGARHDGHAFVGEAVARGARGLLVERAPEEIADSTDGVAVVMVPDTLTALQRLATHWRQRWGGVVVGVTGSVGKTSTKELIASVLGAQRRVLASPGNYNTEVGLPLTLLALEASHQVAVVEMGMYAQGEIRQLARLARPNVGVVTNVGPSHLERLGSLERIAAAKAELVEELPPEGTAVLNADDPRVRAMATRTPARVVLYGVDGGDDGAPAGERLPGGELVRACDVVSHGLDGLSFTLVWKGDRRPVRTALVGRHHVATALAAAGVALALGMSLEQVVQALGAAPPGSRLRVRQTPRGATVLDDTYNASPASTAAALDVLAEARGRRVAVLGDMFELGSYEEEGHRLVGRRAARTADLLVTVGPRAALIAEEALAGGMPRDAVFSCDAKEAAVQVLRRHLQSGDWVLVKGSRGMRMEEIVQALVEQC